MKKYIIKIYNGSGVLVYNDIIEAKDENDALIIFLNNVIICDGDIIKIELSEN